MKQIFASLFVVIALSASTSVMAQDVKKEGKVKTECTSKTDKKECCKKADAGAKVTECCTKEAKACDKKADGKCCSEKKAETGNKSCGKK